MCGIEILISSFSWAGAFEDNWGEMDTLVIVMSDVVSHVSTDILQLKS